MTETIRNLTNSFKIYRTYNKLYKRGLIKKRYEFNDVYQAYKEMIKNG